jgi:hypothetical protein
MKKLLFIGVLLIVGCKPAEDVDPLTGLKISKTQGLPGGLYEFEHKGHEFVYASYGGLIHAPYCDCFKQKIPNL